MKLVPLIDEIQEVGAQAPSSLETLQLVPFFGRILLLVHYAPFLPQTQNQIDEDRYAGEDRYLILLVR